MVWKIDLSPGAARSLRKIDKPSQKRIYDFLRYRLAQHDDPRLLGKPLKGDRLGDFWSYRVGDWRVIASIEDAAIKITVIEVSHRRDVYR